METKIIHEAHGCPMCGSEETVSHLGTQSLRDQRKLPVGAKTHLEMQIVPLEQATLSGVLVDALIVHKDVCAQCGLLYSTWSEIQKVQNQTQPNSPVRSTGSNTMKMPFLRG